MAQLYFYYSAMNAGKSTSLLQSAYNYRERGMHSVIYTAALDDRYGVGKVTSRIGLQADAKLYAKDDDLFAGGRLQMLAGFPGINNLQIVIALGSDKNPPGFIVLLIQQIPEVLG